MKKWLFVFLFLLCVSTVSAIEYPYEVTRIRGYIGEQIISSNDFSEKDSDTVKVNPGDNIEIQTTVKNNNDTRTIEDIVVVFKIYEIDDGDNVEDEAEQFDLLPLKSDKQTLNVMIPALADEDEYEAELIVSGFWYNGSGTVEVRRTYNYTFEVEKFYNTSTSNILIDTLNNVTKTFSDVDKKITSTNEKVDQLITTNMNCPGKLDECQTSLTTCGNEKTSTKTNLDDATTALTTCNAEKSSRLTVDQCSTQCDSKINSAEVEVRNNTTIRDLLIGAFIIAIIWYKFIRKPKLMNIPGGARREEADFSIRR